MKNYLSKLYSWQLAIISGVLIGISFHQICFGILAYIGFIPLLHSWFRNNPNNNLFSGYVFGVTYNLISNYWMATNSGAEFIVVVCGEIMTMPGLPRVPAADSIKLNDKGEIEGVF